MVTTKRRRERRRVSATKAAKERRTGFVSTAFRVPDGMSFFKVDKACIKRISLVEYEVGKGNESAEPGWVYYWLIYYVHQKVGADNSTYVCPAKWNNSKCPICEYRNKLIEENCTDEDKLKALKQKQRVLCQVVDHGNEEAGVQLWEGPYWFGFGQKLDNKLELVGEEEEYEYFSRDDEAGMCLELDFAANSYEGRTTYKVDSLSFRPRKVALDESVTSAAVCLEDLIIVEPYEKLKAIFYQTGETKKEEEKESESKTEPVEDDVDVVASVACPACKGKGKSSKGRQCIPCNGTGKLEIDDDDEETTDDGKNDEVKETVPSYDDEKNDEVKETVPSDDDDFDDFDIDDDF